MSLRIRKLVELEREKPKKQQRPTQTNAQCLALCPVKTFGESMTKQGLEDETNINRLLSRAQRAGTLSHLQKYEPMYGEMADFDFLTAQLTLRKAQESFDALPSEIRYEFHNSPAEFFKFVNDPENKDKLAEKLPALAKPGRQHISLKPGAEVAAMATAAVEAAMAASAAEEAEPPSSDPPEPSSE